MFEFNYFYRRTFVYDLLLSLSAAARHVNNLELSNFNDMSAIFC